MHEGYLLALLVLGTIGAAIVMVQYRDLIWPAAPAAGRSVNRSHARPPAIAAPAGRQPAAASRSAGPRRRVQRSNAPNERSAQQNAENTSVQRSNVQTERSEASEEQHEVGVITLTAKELTQLAEALKFHAAGQSKQASIEAAFGCSKGAGETWRRASQLFDLALGKS